MNGLFTAYYNDPPPSIEDSEKLLVFKKSMPMGMNMLLYTYATIINRITGAISVGNI